MRYRMLCTNEQCGHYEKWTTNFVTRDDVCEKCNSVTKCTEDSLINKGQSTSTGPALLSGVGEINKRLPGDFRDLMHSIKKNTPNCNMKDYK